MVTEMKDLKDTKDKKENPLGNSYYLYFPYPLYHPSFLCYSKTAYLTFISWK